MKDSGVINITSDNLIRAVQRYLDKDPRAKTTVILYNSYIVNFYKVIYDHTFITKTSVLNLGNCKKESDPKTTIPMEEIVKIIGDLREGASNHKSYTKKKTAL